MKVLAIVNRYIMNTKMNVDGIEITSPKEIKKIFMSLKNDKFPGIDDITGIILKNLTRKVMVKLTQIIHGILSFNYFPSV